MKLRRLLLPVFLGALVGCVVMVWPVRPVWTGKTEVEGRLQGFSPDGGEVITTHYDPGPSGSAYACRWDVATGELAAKVEFEETKGKGPYQFYRLMNDRQTLIAGYGTIEKPNQASVSMLFDTRNGKRVAGPFEAAQGVEGIFDDSTGNGRWFALSRNDGEGRAIDLFSRETGFLHRWRVEGQWSPQNILVSPMGNEAVIQYGKRRPTADPRPPVDAQDVGQPKRCVFYELPACIETKRFDFGEADYSYLRSWDGRRLQVHKRTKHRGGRDSMTQVLYYRTEGPVVAAETEDGHLRSYFEGPLLMRYIQHGEDWVAYLGFPQGGRPKEWWEPPRDWVYEKLGIKANDPRGLWGHVKILDRTTGRFRGSIPQWVMISIVISPDGKWLASSLEDGGIAMWDLDPMPRWMKAVPAGVGTFALLMLWGWWRGRRKAAVGAAA